MKKKFLSLMLVVAMMAGILPTISFAAKLDGEITFVDASDNDKTVRYFEEDDKICAKLEAIAQGDGTINWCAASYKNGVLLGCDMSSSSYGFSNYAELNITTNTIKIADGADEVRVFAWDMKNNNKPLIAPGVIYKKPTGGSGSSTDVNNQNGFVGEEVSLVGENVSASVPEGVQLESGATELTLTMQSLDSSASGVEAGEGQALQSFDVHIDGVAEENNVPIIVTVDNFTKEGYNKGNLELYHVEKDGTKELSEVNSVAELNEHNTYYYNPETGTLTLALASFSEIAVVADTEKEWEGKFDYSWYDADKTELKISNADQLAAFGAIVGGMNGQTQDSFTGKTVMLTADINLNDAESENTEKIFHPIGYYLIDGKCSVNSFEGIFDGNGHTISNFYQNTWEIKGDYSGNYYNDAMGLFGYVVNGKVMNLTVDNFSSDGEFTPTGVIAAYAVNSTFENIAITNCNPRVYNTGNGGIVGIGGNSDDPDSYKLTFTNITIDNSNKISALWGSWDVACGGLVGMFRGAGHAYMTNCHVAAQMDVNNDVCGNYQYYWYRYAGMMIGTNKNMTTDANGYTVPETDKFHAENCTVHFGEWNDYYYCELVANSLASYTHDHQFSRLEQVDSVDTTNMTVTVGEKITAIPTSGRYNYVVVKGEPATENATCYHFVDGAVWTHDMAGAEESVDVNNDGVIDEKDLKEDRQHYYLPFNQLFTGYGWGVKHIPLGEFDGVTILGREVADSVEKFETKFTGDFLYRVGNAENSPVALGSLFAAKDGVEINNSGVYVSIDKVDENMNVSGTFKADTTDWTKGTIQFTGTGVVKVTIQDYEYCTPTILYLEVIDATNLTSAEGTTSGGNFVLLGDVNTSNYVYYWNSTLYGNGFTYSLNGAPTNYSSSHGHGVLITKNATLDNVVIVGDVYDSYGAYTTQNYYNSAIDVLGDTTIQNCYISGCAAPVSTRANATIKNSTLYGGAVANLIIKSGTVTLENVIAANYDDGRSVVGMGIVAHSDATESAKLILKGTLTQYNFVNEEDTPTDTYAKNLHSTMFGSSLSKYHFGTSPNRRVNTGIISLTASFNAEDITDNANTGYVGTAVTVSGVNGYVYTQPNTSGDVNNGYDKENDPHVATAYGEVPPSYKFDYTTKNYVAKTEGSNDYCYEENGNVNISMDKGDTFNWDTSILSVTKGNEKLEYTVSMNGTDYTDKSIAFNTADDYEVVYTYTDNNNYKLDEDGTIVKYEVTYTQVVYITVAVVEAATKHAEFTFGSSNTASTTVTIGNNTYVMPNVSATSSTIGSTTVSGQTIYYPIVEIVMSDGKTSHTSGWYAYFPVFSGAVTITDYKDNGLGDAETFGSSTQSMPSGLSVVGDPAQLFKYQSSSTAGTSPVVKNNILVYSSPSISAKRSEYNTVIQYLYTDNAGAAYYYYIGYHAPAQSYSSICVTPDTLVTLSDGSKKEIQYVSVGEEVLAWSFTEGKYVAVPASLAQIDGVGVMDVLHLKFEDGTILKVLGEHGIFDAELNTFIFIDKDDVEEYLGHSFIKKDGDSYKTVKLVDYEITTEDTQAYTILSTEHYNVILEDMFTVTPAHVGGNFFNPFEIGEGLKYDAESMQADIEKYGLYTYEDFAHVLTYEQFIALNIPQFKVSVGKGLVTYEGLIYLIENFINR